MTKNGKYFIFFCENIAQSLRIEFGGYNKNEFLNQETHFILQFIHKLFKMLALFFKVFVVIIACCCR